MDSRSTGSGYLKVSLLRGIRGNVVNYLEHYLASFAVFLCHRKKMKRYGKFSTTEQRLMTDVLFAYGTREQELSD